MGILCETLAIPALISSWPHAYIVVIMHFAIYVYMYGRLHQYLWNEILQLTLSSIFTNTTDNVAGAILKAWGNLDRGQVPLTRW